MRPSELVSSDFADYFSKLFDHGSNQPLQFRCLTASGGERISVIRRCLLPVHAGDRASQISKELKNSACGGLEA